MPTWQIVMGLANFVPQIMRYFGAGEQSATVADKVVDIAKQVTGTESGEDALAALQKDPALVARLQEQTLAAHVELENAYLSDVQDARKRDTQLHQMGQRNIRADLMVLFDVVGLIAGLICLVYIGYFKAMHPEAMSEGAFAALVTQLANITAYFGLSLRDAHQFEFGSSRSSRDKDSFIAGQVTIGRPK